MKAIFRHGNPLMIDHTPSQAVSAGDVVIIDSRTYIAHRDIPANTLGALAAGGGVYDFEKDGTSGPDISDGEDLYWIVADGLATDVAGSNPKLGRAVGAAGASVAVVRGIHDPAEDS